MNYFNETLDEFLQKEVNDEMTFIHESTDHYRNQDQFDKLVKSIVNFHADKKTSNLHSNNFNDYDINTDFSIVKCCEDDDTDIDKEEVKSNSKTIKLRKNCLIDPYALKMKNMLQFPKKYVQCWNSGDRKLLRNLISSLFNPNCTYEICFPHRVIKFVNPDAILVAFNKLLETYPDGLIFLKNASYSRDPRNYQRIMKTTMILAGTKTNESYEDFAGLQPNSLLEYLDDNNLSQQMKNEVEIIKNKNILTKRYYKRVCKAYIDEETNLITALEVKVSLINFKVVSV